MQSRSVWVPSLNFQVSHLLSLFGCLLFSQGNAGAFWIVGYFAVLNDPAFGPVRADHTFLIGGGRGPLGGGFGNGKAGQGNVAYTFFIRIEAVPRTLISTFSLFGSAPWKLAVDHSLIFSLRLVLYTRCKQKNQDPRIYGILQDLKLYQAR